MYGRLGIFATDIDTASGDAHVANERKFVRRIIEGEVRRTSSWLGCESFRKTVEGTEKKRRAVAMQRTQHLV